MSNERHEELASLYAFGLLDGPEKHTFEAELAQSARLRALVDELQTVSADLALAAPDAAPPATLRAQILAAATDAPSSEAGKVVDFPLNRFLPWAAAAGLAIAAVWFGVRSNGLQAANDSLATQRELAEVAARLAKSQLAERTLLAEQMIADLRNQLRTSEDLGRLRVTALASLLGNSPEARAIAVWDPSQATGLLTVEKLPAISAEQDYQIWVIDPQYPIPVDGGVFKPDAEGRATLTFKGDKPIQKVSAFAISLEKKGGVPKAEGPLVLLGKQ
jgi:anti-sigma-K factor RskA